MSFLLEVDAVLANLLEGDELWGFAIVLASTAQAGPVSLLGARTMGRSFKSSVPPRRMRVNLSALPMVRAKCPPATPSFSHPLHIPGSSLRHPAAAPARHVKLDRLSPWRVPSPEGHPWQPRSTSQAAIPVNTKGVGLNSRGIQPAASTTMPRSSGGLGYPGFGSQDPSLPGTGFTVARESNRNHPAQTPFPHARAHRRAQIDSLSNPTICAITAGCHMAQNGGVGSVHGTGHPGFAPAGFLRPEKSRRREPGLLNSPLRGKKARP